jgi:hypothetical protein
MKPYSLDVVLDGTFRMFSFHVTQHHADDPSIVDAARIEGIENAVFLEGDQ